MNPYLQKIKTFIMEYPFTVLYLFLIILQLWAARMPFGHRGNSEAQAIFDAFGSSFDNLSRSLDLPNKSGTKFNDIAKQFKNINYVDAYDNSYFEYISIYFTNVVPVICILVILGMSLLETLKILQLRYRKTVLFLTILAILYSMLIISLQKELGTGIVMTLGLLVLTLSIRKGQRKNSKTAIAIADTTPIVSVSEVNT